MGTAEVIAEQKKLTYTPYVRCHLTRDGYDTYTYTTADETNLVLKVTQKQQPFSELVTVVLSNADQALSAIDFRGYQLTLGFGFIIASTPDYIDQALTWVTEQSYDSREGVLTVILTCTGIMSLLDEDHASELEWTATDWMTMEYLIEGIFNGNVIPYSHCQTFSVDWSGCTLGTDVNLFTPEDMFSVTLNDGRLDMLRLLLEHTYVLPRPDSSGTVCFIKPVTTGEDYAYEYELSGDHNFHIKYDHRQANLPSKVTVYGGEYDENTDTWAYDGSDTVTAYLWEITYFAGYGSLESDVQCAAVAGAILSQFQMNKRLCNALVPMNCTQQLYDYIKITDARQGDSITGNVGMITRIYESGDYTMEIGFGGWLSKRQVARFAEAYRKPSKSNITWITVSCPETYLLPDDSITFHVIPEMEGGADRLYVKSYNVYAVGISGIKLKIVQNDVTKWSVEADTYRKLWTYMFVGVTDDGAFSFVIQNDNAEEGCYVSAFITYGLSTTTPLL